MHHRSIHQTLNSCLILIITDKTYTLSCLINYTFVLIYLGKCQYHMLYHFIDNLIYEKAKETRNSCEIIIVLKISNV